MNKSKLEIEGIAAAKLGSVGRLEDGRKFVRFERHLPHPLHKVWAAITDADCLAGWFPGLKLECRVGGKFEIWFGDECEGPAHLTGTVTRFDAPKVLECGSMRYELSGDGRQCTLVFTDVFHYEGPLTEAEVINSVLGGWHKYLDMLEFAFEGGAADPRNEEEFDYSKVQIEGRD